MIGRATLAAVAATLGLAAPAAADVSISSGGTVAESAGTTRFVVSRDGGLLQGPASVTATLSGTAGCPADARLDDDATPCVTSVPLAGSLAPTTADIDVALVDDALHEADEQLVVTLSAPTEGEELDPEADRGTRTLTGADLPVLRLSSASASATEGAPLVFTVTRTGATTLPASATYEATRRAATEAADVEGALTGTVTLAPDESSKTFSVATAPDLTDEPAEGLDVALKRPSQATLGTPAEAVGTITDDDDPPVPTVSPATASEGAALPFTVSLPLASELDVTFDWAVALGTAEAGDLTGPTSGRVTIPAGATTGSFAVASAEDTVYETAETFAVGGGGTGTIEPDEDAAPTLTITGGLEETVPEGSRIDVEVTRGGNATEEPAAARWTVTDAADVAGPATGTVTVPVGATTATISIVSAQDSIDEAGEALTLTLDQPVDATLTGTTSGSRAIADDDEALASVARLTIDEAASTALIPVTLSVPSDRPTSVAYATENGTAVAGEDFTATAGRVAFAPGETQQVVAVPLTDDDAVEGDEVFDVVLSAPDAVGLAADRAQVTVTSGDTASAPATGAGGPVAAPGRRASTDTTAPAPRLAKLKLRKDKLTVRLSCPVGEPLCRATLSILTVPIRNAKDARLRRELKLGTRIAVVPGGRTATFTVRLSKSRYKLLRGVRSFKAAAFAVVRDGAGNVGTASVTSTLKAR